METKPFCPKCNQPLHFATDAGQKVLACLHCGKVYCESVFLVKKAQGRKDTAKTPSSILRDTQRQGEGCAKMIVELPLPPKALSPNAGYSGNWWVKSKAGKQYRADCAMLLWNARDKAGGILFPDGCILTYEWFCGNNRKGDGLLRPTDIDNAISSAGKKIQDCLMDACYIPNDTAQYVSIKEVKLYRKQKEHQGRCCIVLMIEGKGERE